jgi:hypothetical protein
MKKSFEKLGLESMGAKEITFLISTKVFSMSRVKENTWSFLSRS